MCIGFASRLIILGIFLVNIQACSLPKHSNTLMFGTNTKFALDVSADPTGIPSFTFGYKRQEAVWMPLRTNKEDQCDNCCQTAADTCKYIGKDGNDKTDTYSVLASFGAEFAGGANAQGQEAKASGALAQYFATGLAARELARSGGAALVSTSQNAVSPEALRIAAAGIAENQGIIGQIAECITDENGSVNETRLTNLLEGTPYSGDSTLTSLVGESRAALEARLKGLGNSVKELTKNMPAACNS